MGFNLGGLANRLLPFDPTPGFNVRNPFADDNKSKSWSLNSGGGSFIGPTAGGLPRPSQQITNDITRPGYTGGVSRQQNAARPGAATLAAGSGSLRSAAEIAAADREAAAKQDTLRYLTDQANKYQGEYDYINTAKEQGLKGLMDSYNKEVNSANSQRTRALENYGIQRSDTIRGRDNALDKVNTNARMLADSLRRRLSMAGGSDSSAYKFAAPNAVAREASENRGNVLEDYGANFRGLDMAEKRATDDFSSLLKDLEAQKRSSERKFLGGILEERRGVDEQLAEIARQRALAEGGDYADVRRAVSPFEDRVASRRASIEGLFDRYRNPYKVNPVNPQVVNLRDYMIDKTAIAANQQAGTENPYSPYVPVFTEEEDEEVLL